MGVAPVGGTPDTIASGGATLTSASAQVHHLNAALRTAGSGAGSAGDPDLASAIRHFAAAAEGFVNAIEIQLAAAGELATNAASDLDTAGGAR